MADRPKLIDNRTNQEIPDAPEHKSSGVSTTDQNSPRAKAARARKDWVRAILNSVATAGFETGSQLHREDRDALLAAVEKDAASAPPRVRKAIRTEATRILDRIESGDRIGAQTRASEQSVIIAGDLPGTFVPPSDESPAELADKIAR